MNMYIIHWGSLAMIVKNAIIPNTKYLNMG